MPFQNIVMRPGVNAQTTPTLNSGGWSSCNLIRFKDAMVQKLGGWTRLTSTPMVGTCRGMHAWADLSANPYLACGSDQRLMLYSTSGLNDITPLRATDPTNNSAVNLSTINTSNQVTIIDANCTQTVNVGDWVRIITDASVGGIVLQEYYIVSAVTNTTTYTITAGANATSTVNNGGAVATYTTVNTQPTVTVTLNNHGFVPTNIYNVDVSTTVATVTIFGQYLVQSVINANQFTITAGSNANANTTASENGGNIRISYLLASGFGSAMAITGYGSGTYGNSGYGQSTGGAVYTTIRQWSLDNWGEFLVACPVDQGIYYWQPAGGIAPATVVTNSPTKNRQIIVSNPAQILISLGAETGGSQDHMLVRWCDVANFNQWTAASTNQAGSFRLPNGSQIVGGIQSSLQAFIWTDVDVWSMQYIGQPFIYGFQQIGDGCGLMSMRSMTVAGGRVVWMGRKGFFQMQGGAVSPLKCDVWDILFANLSATQTDKIFCAQNSMFNEVAWFFPSASGNGEIDTYIKVNLVEGSWDYGSLIRTAWVDVSVWGAPIGVDGSGLLQQHETSNDNDGAVLDSWVQSGDIDIASGEEYVFVDYLVLDAKLSGSGTPTVYLTLSSKEFPNSTPLTQGPYAITPTSTDATPRLRGRQINFKLESTGLGSFWRVGRTRYRVASDGRR